MTNFDRHAEFCKLKFSKPQQAAVARLYGHPIQRLPEQPESHDIVACIIKRDGKGFRKTEPNWRTQPVQWCSWSAYKFVVNTANWGYDGSWRDGRTGKLIMMDPAQRELFEDCVEVWRHLHATLKARAMARNAAAQEPVER